MAISSMLHTLQVVPKQNGKVYTPPPPTNINPWLARNNECLQHTSGPSLVNGFLRLFTFSLLLLSSLQNTKNINFTTVTIYYRYHYYHITLLLNTLLQILSYPGVVELPTQLLILENILWPPLCRINKFGSNTLP